MAEIPVERKTGGGLPWWLIPLLLLLILLPLLFFLSRGCNNNTAVTGNANTNTNANRTAATTNANTTTANGVAVVTNNNGAMTGNSATSGNANSGSTGAAVTDTSYFGGVNDKASLVGRKATFQNAKVEKVLSDHVFTVKSGSGEMFVYLDESQDTAGGKEQAVKIRPGQELRLSGDFRRVPNAETATEKNEKQGGGLSSAEYAQMKGQQVYLHATQQKMN